MRGSIADLIIESDKFRLSISNLRPIPILVVITNVVNWDGEKC